jgi:hypothetical protein
VDTDFDALMRANLARVFSEHDRATRDAALDELYVDDCVLYDPDGEYRGRRAISDAVDALLARLGAGAAFRATGAAVGHHGMGRLFWESGPVTGTDVVTVRDGRIVTLHVFLDG